MEALELLAACRPGVPADEMLKAALAGDSYEHGDVGPIAPHDVAFVYKRRTKHLGREGLLAVDESATIADLERVGASAEPLRLVVRIVQEPDGQLVFSTFVAGDPPKVGACLVHRLPGRLQRAQRPPDDVVVTGDW
jgi:hypothetical protein